MCCRIVTLLALAACTLGPVATCLGQNISPVSGVYTYGPPTPGHATPVFHYPKSWRGPRYSYPQAYYFKFPPGRRPVTITPHGVFINQLFFSEATTDAEIWAVRRKGEVTNLPDSARFPLPAKNRLAPTVGPLPARFATQARSRGFDTRSEVTPRTSAQAQWP